MATDKKLVHIRVSDTGWILEKLASEISNRLPYVSYDMYPNGEAAIQYYMTYGCRQQRVSPIEVALFTHKEQVPSAAEKFERVSKEVDFCIAQSLATENILRQDGVAKVQTISPGVDLDRFQPLVRIGVIGRTYHTGRKGEALVAAVMDIPGIEWHFTGPGWPGPSQFIAEEDMPAFYRSLDYVLVPALIEGGPMCVLEALASGCKLIASPVGWVPQFPHIEFELGNANDLRRVLMDVVEEKASLRRSVEAYTWDAWAQQHHQLFTRLLGQDPVVEQASSSVVGIDTTPVPGQGLKAAVVVHGGEVTGSLGGPSVRAPRTAAALTRIGVDAEFHHSRAFSATDYDVVHVMNVWHPVECEALLRQIEMNDRPIVFSPIFLDLSERKHYHARVPEILGKDLDDDRIRHAFAHLRDDLKANQTASEADREPYPGYFSSVRRLITYADHLILLSEHERQLLAGIGVDSSTVTLVRNPVEASVFADGDPKLFEEQFGVTDYVLCVGRIETRKNQAVLAYALRDTGIPLVFVGHEPDQAYSALIRKAGGENLIFTGRIEPNSPLLASAYAGARVFCLPSWSEGAPLVALEAAAAGCNMVLSNRSSEEEYFGDLARYADPADPDDLRQKVLAAYEENRPADKSRRIKALIAERHSWSRYATDTASAYATAVADFACKKASRPIPADDEQTVFVDVTTLAHHKGTPTGMARVEERMANAIANSAAENIQFVYWDAEYQRYFAIDRQTVLDREVNTIRDRIKAENPPAPADRSPFAGMPFSRNDILVNLGSAWMRNANYLRDLAVVKHAIGLKLVTTIYDVIQWKFKSWYPKDASNQFIDSCARLISLSDQVLTCSKSSAIDLVEFSAAVKSSLPRVDIFRLGDEAADFDHEQGVARQDIESLEEGDGFILYVSTLDFRKNHRLLIDLWERLYAERGKAIPHLVLVGSKGWRGEEIASLLNTDQPFLKKIKLLHNINDKTLEWLYCNCMFTVYPSLYEGWGMPVAESLRHGRFCIASNGGSLPEVAPGVAEYLDPRDFMGWYRALLTYISSPALLAEKNAKAAEYVRSEWSESALSVLAAVQGAGTPPRLPAVRSNVPIEFSDTSRPGMQSSAEFMMGGWGRIEKGGCWTVGSGAWLGGQLDSPVREGLALWVRCNGYVPDGEPTDVTVFINDVAVTRWRVGDAVANYSAHIPDGLIGQDRTVLVKFAIVAPKVPAAHGKSADIRPLGIRVATVEISNRLSRGAPNQWLRWPAGNGSFADLLCRAEGDDYPYLCVDLVSDKATDAAILVNGHTEATLSLRPKQRKLAAVRLSARSWKADSSLMRVAISTKTPGSLDSARIGLFNQPPRELIEFMAIERSRGRKPHTKLYGFHFSHVPYSGAGAEAGDGVPVQTVKGAPALQAMFGDWHVPESDWVWTNGDRASLYLKPIGLTGDVLTIVVEYGIYNRLLEIDGDFMIAIGNCRPYKLSRTHTERAAQAFAVLRADAIDAYGRIPITLTSSHGVAPRDLGDSVDSRVLSVRLFSVAVSGETLRNPVIPAMTDFGRSTFSETVDLIGSWYALEADGVWSSGEASSALVDLSDASTEKLRAEIQLSPFADADKDEPLEVYVDVNQSHQHVIRLSDGSPVTEVMEIPPHCLEASKDHLLVTMTCDRSARPSDLGISPDNRRLSFKLNGFRLMGDHGPMAAKATAPQFDAHAQDADRVITDGQGNQAGLVKGPTDPGKGKGKRRRHGGAKLG